MYTANYLWIVFLNVSCARRIVFRFPNKGEASVLFVWQVTCMHTILKVYIIQQCILLFNSAVTPVSRPYCVPTASQDAVESPCTQWGRSEDAEGRSKDPRTRTNRDCFEHAESKRRGPASLQRPGLERGGVAVGSI